MTDVANGRELIVRIESYIENPVFFKDVLAEFDNYPYRKILEAWSDIRIRRPLDRDIHGRYSLSKS